jgi:hypothetical protein
MVTASGDVSHSSGKCLTVFFNDAVAMLGKSTVMCIKVLPSVVTPLVKLGGEQSE